MKKPFWAWVTDLWCRLMHPVPMWPVHGHYRCPACFRQYTVPWEVRPLIVTVDRISSSEHPRVGAARIARPADSW